jgi:outer membrane murein-binding lipoprotein Lpp
VTVVDGERIESQEFEVPRNAGIRLLLVATDPKQAAEDQKAAQAPAQPGTVVFGGESRLVFEVGDDGLNVFNLLQVVNTQKTPVQTAPLVFELPEAALRATVLQGSSQQAVAAGNRVTVTGPFAPGATNVEFAYTLDLSAREMTIRQTLPAALPQVTVLMQRVGEMHMTSPQFSGHRDMTAEGQAYILGQGPALKAGDTLAIELTGVPARATWPRNLALALATLLLAGGAWLAARPRAADDAGARAKQLNARRERLFEKLTELEKQRERLDAERYAERRRELVGALERVYAELDGQAA